VSLVAVFLTKTFFVERHLLTRNRQILLL